MKIVRIFVRGKGEGLWSIQMEGSKLCELEQFFDNVNDGQWLNSFFESNANDLYGGFFRNMSIDDAVSKTLDEFAEMENMLLDCAEAGFQGYHSNLQHLFRPLNNFEYAIYTHQKSKARIYNGWLRLYAIRLSENCYIITGGAIKLTHHMRRAHLQDALKKLEMAKAFIQNMGIVYPEDLNKYYHE